jgi:hypothetical protein
MERELHGSREESSQGAGNVAAADRKPYVAPRLDAQGRLGDVFSSEAHGGTARTVIVFAYGRST